VFVPEIMSIGYDTVESALHGQLGLLLMITIVAIKLLATAGGLGLGLPGGLIGPTVVIGATAGGTIGLIAQMLFPGEFSSHAFYSLIGMATMMAAVLQAPLAALIAMLELTGNPNIILPGMLAVIIASITSKQVIGKDSIYLLLMRARGLDYRHDPVTQALSRIGVMSAMDKSFSTLDTQCETKRASETLQSQPKWVLLRDEEGHYNGLMPAADLARALQDHQDDSIDLMEIPADRLDVTGIHELATLREAHNILETTGSEALYVENRNTPGMIRIQGILHREHIEHSYRV
jgi:hypothetical protein